MERKYSLVIGTYNPNLEWLQEALDSAKDLFDEIILIDDCSDIPVKGATLRHEANKGFYEARNSGIEIATGDIIVSLDDDDILIRENVLKLKEFIENNDADIWHFPIELFGEQTGITFNQPRLNEFLESNQIPSGSWFTKKLWEENNFDYPLAEDWAFWVKAWKKKKRFVYFPLPIYKHRMRAGSLSSNWVGDKFNKIKEDIKIIYENSDNF